MISRDNRAQRNGSHQDRSINLLSWNINDIKDKVLGLKTASLEFLAQLDGQDIFCLQETKEDVKIPLFKCYNKLRGDSRSGGLCIGVRREIDHLVQLMDTEHYHDIMAIRISAEILGVEVILVNVYDSPENSSYKIRRRNEGHFKDTMEELSGFLSSLTCGTPYMIVGDMNARISNHCEPPRSNNNTIDDLIDGSFKSKSYNMTQARNSEDSMINDRGKKLLDFVSEADLRILNGSTLGDIFGRYTCLQYNGSSVVDYMMVSNAITTKVTHLKVLDFTNISDHRPITCRLICTQWFKSQEPMAKYTEQPPKYSWDQERSAAAFQLSQRDPEYIVQCQQACSQECHTREDVVKLNNTLKDLLTTAAHSSLILKGKSKRKQPSRRKPRKNLWFDADCIKSRISLRKACREYCKCPNNDEIRSRYYLKRKEHRKTIKTKKYVYFTKMNQDIEEGHNIRWENFKKLKTEHSTKGDCMDLYDLANFYKFFKDLYSEQTISPEIVSHLNEETISLQQEPTIEGMNQVLNDEITDAELSRNIQKLKRGKAAAEDGLLNEFFKCATDDTKSVVLKVFNECLTHGIYPWNMALITPLHKKGDRSDPNNYRAIAVGSNLGKLFSSILLERLITFRSTYCPDTSNQLGFVKDAQTSDHVFTLNTCIEKYTKQKKRLYACFVDYRKAFDTVCREALLYKLSKLGIKGSYFKCVQHMYQNSGAKLKLLNKISERIDILIGTEQGHPMSPELFKIYLLDLSIDLNDTEGLNMPQLNGTDVSHLLWADDLVLLALDAGSLQKLINRVYDFCEEWGLSVNISKTAIMVFNKSGRQVLESYSFLYGDIKIPSARTYCYLGIVFNLTGSYTAATDELRKKGLKAYFALKKLLQLEALSVKAVFKLFDALILPVVAYGCQNWLQSTQFAKSLINQHRGKTALQKIANDPLERIHLRFLKWTLKVHKKCSNLACYGDSGRYPLTIKISKQVVKYYNRLENLDAAGVNSLVRHAFAEQKLNNLSWYTNMSTLLQMAGYTSQRHGLADPVQIRIKLQEHFDSLWNEQRKNSKKLTYYNLVKNNSSISFENFLALKDSESRKCVMQLRSSSHRLNCETARYKTEKDLEKNHCSSNWFKRCEFCTSEEALLLTHLPFNEVIEEDELHILITCPKYHQQRLNLQEGTKSLLLRNEAHEELYSCEHIRIFGPYVKKLFQTRFPRKKRRRSGQAAGQLS